MRSFLVSGMVSLAFLLSQGLAAEKAAIPSQQKAEEAHDYVRYVGDNLRGKLETVVVTLKNRSGVSVDLIGAVHIADVSYYQTLKQLFTTYEVLLFELVDGQRLKQQPAQAEQQVPATGGSSNVSFTILRSMMQGVGEYLHLQYQTDGIDYHAKNFVHADVSMDEFRRLQALKGESFATLFQKALQAQLAHGDKDNGEPTGGQLLLALLGDSSGIKVAMAKMLGNAETMGEEKGFGSDSVIVGERNRVALEAFDRQLKLGRKHLAIFYGAAHLPDMEKRLEARGFHRTSEKWLTAWDIKPRADEKSKPTDHPDSSAAPTSK